MIFAINLQEIDFASLIKSVPFNKKKHRIDVMIRNNKLR